METLIVLHFLFFLIQDFLRNIPGSLLCVDLYDQWMDVMEGDEGEERTQAVNR